VSAHEDPPEDGSEPDPLARGVPGPTAGGGAGADPGQAANEASGAKASRGDSSSGPEASGGDSSSGPPNEGVIDLLGLLAYASLVAFFRLADDASLSASLPDKADLADMAVAQFGHFELLRTRINELGADPEQAMRPFVEAIDAFHARTAPSSWLEGLVKAYVGDGIAADFYRVIAQLVDQPTRSLVDLVLADTGRAQFVIARVREAIAADPAVAGRLALWARRLVGEALSQAQLVAAERESLARLLAGGSAAQLGEIGRMFAAVTDAHAQRMAALGLAN
jgi:tRNA-(MS[2]IO[6]A)-hydroxylase MiaE-like protein